MSNDNGAGATAIRTPGRLDGLASAATEANARHLAPGGGREKRQVRSDRLRHALARTVLAAAVTSLLPLRIAGAEEPPAAEIARDFDLPAGELAAALDALRAQGGIDITYEPGLVAGRRASALQGRMGWRAALDRLLQGSGLDYRQVDGRIIVADRSEGSAGLADRPGPARPEATAPQRAAPKPVATEMAAITVTGTRIRGGSTPSPVIAIDGERMRDEGFADLGEVIRTVPQNFSGGQSPGIAAGATGGGQGNQNITGGSGINLRGLGQDATLTLLNGRRMSYGGFTQMVDISAIPLDAVDRVEIVADGASALYGSDAVGGVANVILHREFDGVAIGTRHGAATAGGLDTHEYTATAGTTWSTGGMIVTWKRGSNDPVYSNQRRYTRAMHDPSTLYQAGDLRSGLLSAHQGLGEWAELRLDAFRTERKIFTEMAYSSNYEHSAPETTTSFVAPGVSFFLPGDWLLSLGATWGREQTDASNTVVIPSAGTSSFTRTSYLNNSRTYEANAEGPVFQLPAGEARLAVGGGYRFNDFRNRNLVSGYTQVDGDVRSRFAYAELSVPVVGPDQSVPGMRHLFLTGAMRSEDYDSFGSVTTPKLGLVYSPSADFTLKFSGGKSFKVPTLSQQYLGRDAILFPALALGGVGYAPDATVLYLVGGNPDLDPERARTWSASLAFHPQALPGLEAELTWFDIDYTDRVVQPLVPAQALSNPAFAEFIRHAPTAAELADTLQGFRFTNATGAEFNPDGVVAIAPNLYRNTSRQRARGVDLSGSYRFDLARGRLLLRGSASWLDSSRQVSSGQPADDLSGTLFHPARVNARAGLVWHPDGFTASIFSNYRSGVINPVDGRKGASFTTFDAVLRYDIDAQNGEWSDLTLELSVQNVFDRAPPLYAVTSLTFAPYDSTNYSAIGRYVGFSVSKRW